MGGRMDWFFNQWVYGTEIPHFKYHDKTVAQDDGTYIVSGSIVQSEVTAPFRVFMPITLEFAEGQKSTFVQEITDWKTTFTTPPLPAKPKKVIFNDYDGVLSRN